MCLGSRSPGRKPLVLRRAPSFRPQGGLVAPRPPLLPGHVRAAGGRRAHRSLRWPEVRGSNDAPTPPSSAMWVKRGGKGFRETLGGRHQSVVGLGRGRRGPHPFLPHAELSASATRIWVHVLIFLILTSLIYLELISVKTSEKRGLDKKW